MLKSIQRPLRTATKNTITTDPIKKFQTVQETADECLFTIPFSNKAKL